MADQLQKGCAESIPECERAKSMKDLDFESMAVERALGLNWDVHSDTLQFRVKVKEKPPTRRGILSLVSSVYDPLGFAGPFLLPAEALLQDLCRMKLGWDDVIPEESLKCWQQWLGELPKLEDYQVTRCVQPRGFDDIVSRELHHFSDASQQGYGAVTYLRVVNSDGRIHCAFLIAKSRLTPLKTISIPRLELSAATVSIRLDKMMRKELELPIDVSHFWTDSTTVLKYIHNEDKRFHTFVANRIVVVRDDSDPCQWRHVDTKLNPADDASRGLTADEFLKYRRWTNGHDFLWEPETTWHSPSSDTLKIADGDPEVKKESTSCAVVTDSEVTTMDRVLERFSSWMKLIKFVAWMLRYRNNLRAATHDDRPDPAKAKFEGTLKPVCVDEMKAAELSVVKYIQEKCFPEEIQSLRKPPTVGKVTKGTVKKVSHVYH